MATEDLGSKRLRFPRTPSRRDFLQVGVVGGLGLTLGEALRRQAHASPKTYETSEGTAKSVINIFLPGGMASQESFDPKRFAPVEYRGPYASIATRIDGEHFGQLFPHTAGVADKLCVIRAMSHGEAAHERGTHNMFSGYRPSPALKYPSMGSIVSHEFGARGSLPPYVCIPNLPTVDAGSGYLSSAYGPFSLGADPASDGFQVKDLSLFGGITPERFARQRTMIAAADEHFRTLERSDALDAMDSFYQRAYAMISSTEAREAFNLKAEPEAIRNEYGAHAAGRRMLLARRLVEAGVRFVTLTFGSWDHHDNIHGQMAANVPPLDQGFAALIADLDRRGLLQSTIVMLTTEFGRTPKINNTAGRDHYPKVYSIVMAGGGLKRGFVYGKSDATSTEPAEDALGVEDWAFTLYHQLGINADKELMAPGDRPIEIIANGNVIQDLLA
ncbi:MAG TPA: DUF1501 domain-containing protein [Pirellulales bacterium]|nr:DUF1501 domain-containing protein [Pirellulales bacterium]